MSGSSPAPTARLGAVAALSTMLGLLGCQVDGHGDPTGAETEPTERVVLGDFGIEVDPRTGSVVLSFYDSSVRGLVREIPFGADGDPNTNPPGTIQAVTTNPRGPNENGCPDFTNCFTVQLTNFTGTPQFDVFMGIDSIAPPTGRDLVGPDAVPAGVNAALGGRAFGDLANGASSAALQLDFTVPSSSAYIVRGRFWGDNGVLNPVDLNGRPTGNSAPLNVGIAPDSDVDENGRGMTPFSAGSPQTTDVDLNGRSL